MDAEGRFYSVHSGSHIGPPTCAPSETRLRGNAHLLVSRKLGYELLMGLRYPQIALLTNSQRIINMHIHKLENFSYNVLCREMFRIVKYYGCKGLGGSFLMLYKCTNNL